MKKETMDWLELPQVLEVRDFYDILCVPCRCARWRKCDPTYSYQICRISWTDGQTLRHFGCPLVVANTIKSYEVNILCPCIKSYVNGVLDSRCRATLVEPTSIWQLFFFFLRVWRKYSLRNTAKGAPPLMMIVKQNNPKLWTDLT